MAASVTLLQLASDVPVADTVLGRFPVFDHVQALPARVKNTGDQIMSATCHVAMEEVVERVGYAHTYFRRMMVPAYPSIDTGLTLLYENCPAFGVSLTPGDYDLVLLIRNSVALGTYTTRIIPISVGTTSANSNVVSFAGSQFHDIAGALSLPIGSENYAITSLFLRRRADNMYWIVYNNRGASSHLPSDWVDMTPYGGAGTWGLPVGFVYGAWVWGVDSFPSMGGYLVAEDWDNYRVPDGVLTDWPVMTTGILRPGEARVCLLYIYSHLAGSAVDHILRETVNVPWLNPRYANMCARADIEGQPVSNPVTLRDTKLLEWETPPLDQNAIDAMVADGSIQHAKTLAYAQVRALAIPLTLDSRGAYYRVDAASEFDARSGFGAIWSWLIGATLLAGTEQQIEFLLVRKYASMKTSCAGGPSRERVVQVVQLCIGSGIRMYALKSVADARYVFIRNIPDTQLTAATLEMTPLPWVVGEFCKLVDQYGGHVNQHAYIRDSIEFAPTEEVLVKLQLRFTEQLPYPSRNLSCSIRGSFR